MEMVQQIVFDILSIIGITLGAISFYRLTDCFVDIKPKRIYKVIAFIGIWVVVPVIIYVSDLVNVGYTLIGFTMMMLICYQGSIIRKISVVMVLYPIVVAANYLFRGLYRISVYFNYVVWVFILALFWYVIHQVMKDKIHYAKQYISNKTWILIDIICFTPFLAIIVTIIWTGHDEQYKAYIIAGISICSNIGVLFLLNYIIDSVKVRLANQNYQLQYDYYKSLEEEQIRTRKIYHDMNNNFQVVRTYMENQNLDQARDYFDKLLQKANTYRSKTFCKNSIVNAVLNNKYNNIVSNDIDCHMNIAIDNIISIDDMDLCSIFANTLDNAIEASIHIKESAQRKIIIKARINKDYFSYAITNNKVNDVFTHKGDIISSKQDKRRHGYGLQNVQDIVNKYHGTLDINYTDSEFSVIMIIRKFG